MHFTSWAAWNRSRPTWGSAGTSVGEGCAANHMSIYNIATMPDEVAGVEASHFVRKGEEWLLRHIQHTAGIYGFFARLALAARQQPAQALCWWETGAVCERRYQVGEHWYNLRPDALAEYRIGRRQFCVGFARKGTSSRRGQVLAATMACAHKSPELLHGIRPLASQRNEHAK
jgi:hypothetical protein